MTSDEILRAALIQTADEYFSRYEPAENEKPHRFSLAFYIRKISVERLARKAEKTAPRDLPQRRYIPLKRLAVIMVVVFAAVFLTAAAWVAYISVRGFVFEVHTTHSDVIVDPSLYEIKEEITEFYWLPPESGCVYVSEIGEKDVKMIEYTYDDKPLDFAQYSGSLSEHHMTVNTENAEVFEVNVNGDWGFICVRHREMNDDAAFITWLKDGYVLQISCTSITNDELIRLAESTVMRD